MLKHGISIVIPVYGSEQTIQLLYEEIVATLTKMSSKIDFEVLLVNDSSPDHVEDKISELKQRDTRVRSWTFATNFGQHNALLFGIRQAGYDVIITMDDDGQHDPSAIPGLLSVIGPDVDLVYGCPPAENRGAFRSWASRFMKRMLCNLLGVKGAQSIASYRCFKTSLREVFAGYDGADVFIDALLAWSTKKVVSRDVPLRNRSAGQSGYSFRKLVRHTLNMITGFSVVPLRMACICGLIMAFLGLLILVIVGVRFLIFGRDVPGFMLLISTIVLFSGIQLTTLGIFGEYIGRIYLRQMKRPQYVLKS